MAATSTSAALLLLLATAAASMQYATASCTECQFCGSNDVNCLTTCQKTCPSPPPPPSPSSAIGDCQGFGRVAAADVSSRACETTKNFCQGGAQALAARAQEVQVSLTQCENIAFGVCQSESLNNSPCQNELNNGYQQCSVQQFKDFYTGEINELCEQKVKDIAP